MSSNFFKIQPVLILRLVLAYSLIFCPTISSSSESSSVEAIKQFKKALRYQRLGRTKEARNLIENFPNHPLYGYLVYQDLKRRLNKNNISEIDSFLAKEKGSRIEKLLRKRWLNRLHRNRQWSSFLDYYQKGRFSESAITCKFYEAKIRLGQGASIIEEVKSTWNQGTSLPKECDPAFKFLYNTGSLTDSIVWERIKKSYHKNNVSLAKYLTRYLTDKKLVKLRRDLDYARRSPRRFFQKNKLPDTPEARDVLVYGIKRLSRSSLEKTLQLWTTISIKYDFSKQQRSEALISLGTAATRVQDERALYFFDEIEEQFITQSAERNRLAMGIYFQDWPKIIKWTSRPARNDISRSRLDFWRAYALGKVGREIESNKLLNTIAKRRDYHGFLAADILGTEYQFNHRMVQFTKKQMSTILEASNFGRANELFKIGKTLEAKREFFHELDRSTDHHLEFAAKLADTWNWPKGSIFALGRASSYDDLELRFPLRYLKEIEEQLVPRDKYVVRKGDSLWKISKRFRVTINKLRQWNKLRKNAVIQPGQQLIVNEGSSFKSNKRQLLYTVKNGDSLWKISKNHEVSIKDLRHWNHLNSGDVLKVGAELKIGQVYKKFKSLSLNRTLAIIRAESAFDPFARSTANARGLMQIIPSTARLTARQNGIRLGRIKNLYKPQLNIMIGTAYLSGLLAKFDGNFAMAAAAYNAGPHRARRWQKKRCGDPRMWIDSIPITETRRYVRRAIFYSRIYEWRLGLPVKRISEEIGLIPHHNNKFRKKGCWL